MKVIHVIELKSIIGIESKILLINKNNPDKTLIEIPYNELELLRSGWQKYKQRVTYNGKTYWLHPKYIDELPEKLRNTNLLGIKVTNDYQDEYKVDPKILKSIPRDEEITIVLEESVDFKIRNSAIDEIEKTLKKNGYNILHFTSIRPKQQRGEATGDLILSYLSGYKVKKEEFSTLESSKFDAVNYYDKDSEMLDYLEDIDTNFENRYENSQKQIQKEIYNDLKFNRSGYIVNLMHLLSNKKNPIKKTTKKLGLNLQFEHLLTYQKFTKNI